MHNDILIALNEINNNLKNLSPAWLPALFALAGAIGAAFVVGYWQFKNTKLNTEFLKKSKLLEIKSEVVSKQRQQWMTEIRHTCKKFLSDYDVIISSIQDDKHTQEQHNIIYKNASENANLMILMLNPENSKQQEAITAISNIQNILAEKEGKSPIQIKNEYDEFRSHLLESLVAIFRITWKKIKNLE